MKRRDFLKGTAALGAGMVLPTVPRLDLHAANHGYSGPLWLTIEAFGGWDPTSFCDPKGDANGVNRYTGSGIAIEGSPITYAPPPQALVDSGLADRLYSNAAFFTKHYGRLLVVNGIDTKTLSHADGRRHTWSGQLSAARPYPSMAAMLAGLLGPSRSLSFITSGGTAGGAGLIVPIKLTNTSGAELYELAYPNRVNGILPGETPVDHYLPEDVFALVKNANTERLQRLSQPQQLQRLRQSLAAFTGTRAAVNDIAGLVAYLEANPPARDTDSFVVAANDDPRDQARRIYELGRMAIAAHQAGTCVAAHIHMSGFDTHGNHDADHYPRLMDLLMGIDAIVDEAQARGVMNDIVIMVGSDFGRTNSYNDQDGKDHWPITSMMFMGEGRIAGNRVIGATDDMHQRLHLDPVDIGQSVPADHPNGIRLQPAHIHRAVRTLAGVDQFPESTTSFRLDGEDLNLFSV